MASTSTADQHLELYISGVWFRNDAERKIVSDTLKEIGKQHNVSFYDYTDPSHTNMSIKEQIHSIIRFCTVKSDGYIIDRTHRKHDELDKTGAYIASVVAYLGIPVFVVDPVKHTPDSHDKKQRTIAPQFRCGFGTAFFHHVETVGEAIEALRKIKYEHKSLPQS